MTVVNVLDKVFKLLDKEPNYNTDSTGDYNLLMQSFNDTIAELCEFYVPIKKCKSVTANDKKILFSALDNNCYKIYSVKRDGIDADHEIMDDYIKVNDNETYEILYSVLPTTYSTITANINLPKLITERCLVYGTAATYCLARGRYEDSVNFYKKYEQIVLALTRKTSQHVRARRFV